MRTVARTDATSGPRRWLLGGALLLLAVTWLGPLPAWSRHSFAAHMAMHMTVVAVAAPLLAGAIAGSALDPARRWPASWAAAPGFAIAASVVEFVVVWGWHAPALHRAARHAAGMLWLEQASFLGVGLLLWLAAFGDGPTRRRERAAAGAVGLLLTSMHMTLLGVLLALATRPLYPHAEAAGADALLDQQLGGVLMLAFGGVAYLLGGLLLLRSLLRTRQEACR